MSQLLVPIREHGLSNRTTLKKTKCAHIEFLDLLDHFLYVIGTQIGMRTDHHQLCDPLIGR